MDKQAKKDYGIEIHNQVIGWTENCDTKASILIAFLGIFVSILFTSDYVLSSLQELISPIFIYWKTGNGGFHFFSLTIFILLGLSVFFMGSTIVLLFNVLSGKTICNENSNIFFGKIQEQPIDEYLNKIDTIDEEEVLKDGFIQIHNCSKRCAEKFSNYNKAVVKTKWGLLFLALFMICILVHNA
ncbi:hypothetical protein [Bacteroides sp. UBA939]|uniref:hypothetical protein n=1 Tax=Bacteroides sp. UBA939 TaxID=1946092 RepID=UPI0025C27580|nr:hypothetical protein [Bacteroides sp. UBA939]